LRNLLDIPAPDCFAWIYGKFIQLYNASDAILTPATIREYEELFQFSFTLYEKELLFRMKNWAADEKDKLEKEVSDE
jgi:hypothetical protein